MSQPWKHASALTAVVQRVLLEGFRQRITGRGTYRRDSEVGPDAFAVTLSALLPLRDSIPGLANASRERCADDGIRAEPVE